MINIFKLNLFFFACPAEGSDPWLMRQSNSSLIRMSTMAVTSIENNKASAKATLDAEVKTGRIYLKDLVCYLSLLEGGGPADKLECKEQQCFLVFLLLLSLTSYTHEPR